MKNTLPIIKNAVSQLDWQQITADTRLRAGAQAEEEVKEMKSTLIAACEFVMQEDVLELHQQFFRICWDPTQPEQFDSLTIEYNLKGFPSMVPGKKKEKAPTPESEIADLKAKKSILIREQKYEAAAIVRDEIMRLEKQRKDADQG